jgi:hypothetical protein
LGALWQKAGELSYRGVMALSREFRYSVAKA